MNSPALIASACAAARVRLRGNGWRVVSYTEAVNGNQRLHVYSLAHNNGSWVTGQGPSEIAALDEVEFKIRKYKLNEGPLPSMPYEVSREVGGLMLKFPTPNHSETFMTWLERLMENEKRG